MPAFVFNHVSDERLLADLAALVATDRCTTATMLAHLAEVEERKLYLPAACSSMFVYATRVLRLSEDAAFKRIRVARIARRLPAVLDAIADGRVHLSGVVMLAPHLDETNVDDILAAATHRTKVELEELVARLAPRPDLPTSLVPIDPPGAGAQAQVALGPPPGDDAQVAPGPPPGEESQVAPGPPPAPLAGDATRTKPLAPGRYALTVTISRETQDKIVRAQALLRHRNPRGELAEAIDRAFDALLVTLEKEKFGAAERPRAAKARGEDADARYVPREVRRTVHARDGEQCTFESDDGVRCTERGFIELDHKTAVALGGKPTVDGIRVLCRAHNQYEAERQLGAELVRTKRAARQRRGAGKERVASKPTSEQRAPTATEDGTTSPVGAEIARPCANAGRAESAVSRENADAASCGDPASSAELEREVTLAMRGMGFGASETRKAMAESAGSAPTATTFDARLRAALAAWRGSRCSEGPIDDTVGRLIFACAGVARQSALTPGSVTVSGTAMVS